MQINSFQLQFISRAIAIQYIFWNGACLDVMMVLTLRGFN